MLVCIRKMPIPSDTADNLMISLADTTDNLISNFHLFFLIYLTYCQLYESMCFSGLWMAEIYVIWVILILVFFLKTRIKLGFGVIENIALSRFEWKTIIHKTNLDSWDKAWMMTFYFWILISIRFCCIQIFSSIKF